MKHISMVKWFERLVRSISETIFALMALLVFSTAAFADLGNQVSETYLDSNPNLKPYAQKYADLYARVYQQQYANVPNMKPCMHWYTQMVQAGFKDVHLAMINDIQKQFSQAELVSLTAYHNNQNAVPSDLLTKEKAFDAGKGKDYYRSSWNGQNMKDFFKEQNNPECMKLTAGSLGAAN